MRYDAPPGLARSASRTHELVRVRMTQRLRIELIKARVGFIWRLYAVGALWNGGADGGRADYLTDESGNVLIDER